MDNGENFEPALANSIRKDVRSAGYYKLSC
jgi:hypothetical protein